MNLTDRQREIIRVTLSYCLANYDELNECLYPEEDHDEVEIQYSEIEQILKKLNKEVLWKKNKSLISILSGQIVLQ